MILLVKKMLPVHTLDTIRLSLATTCFTFLMDEMAHGGGAIEMAPHPFNVP